MNIHEYHKQAEDFLAKHGIAFEHVNLGEEVSRMDPKRKNYRYIARFRRTPVNKDFPHAAQNEKQVEFDFHGSIADYEASKNKGMDKHGYFSSFQLKKDKERAVLRPYSVLACLTRQNPGMFSDFCSEYGYAEDSRKAFTTYEAVCEEWKKVSSFFSAAEIEEMQEIQ